MTQYEDYIVLNCMRRFNRAKELYDVTRVRKIDNCTYEIILPYNRRYTLRIARDGEYYCGCSDSKYYPRLCKHVIIFIAKWMNGEIENGKD